jgi:hypothetical protein
MPQPGGGNHRKFLQRSEPSQILEEMPKQFDKKNKMRETAAI